MIKIPLINSEGSFSRCFFLPSVYSIKKTPKKEIIMQALKTRPLLRRGSIIYVPISGISPCPMQPRQFFDEGSLKDLSESIRSYGILNPLTVRMKSGGYELIAGERRLRAAKLAGLKEVPCIVMDINMEDAGLIALIENLQRRDLDFVEEAMGLNQLITMFGMSQEEAARKIGKSQSAVANKLRLLRLPADVLDTLRKNDLTERHGRALLKLTNPNRQREVLRYIIEKELTVAATESYIDMLLEGSEKEKKTVPRRTFVLKDVRVFLNTVTRGLELMKQGGIDAGIKRQETEDSLILTISIPKNRTV